jgi:hypothetical protein
MLGNSTSTQNALNRSAMGLVANMSDDVEMLDAGGGQDLNNWYPELGLELQTPAARFNHGRKRSREETTEPRDERSNAGWNNTFDAIPDADSDYGSLTPNLRPSQDSDGALAPYDGAVEEIPRVKMQTGCIPCLYVKTRQTTRGCV